MTFSLSKEAFDTNRGLWLVTNQNELYPNPHSYATEGMSTWLSASVVLIALRASVELVWIRKPIPIPTRQRRLGVKADKWADWSNTG